MLRDLQTALPEKTPVRRGHAAYQHTMIIRNTYQSIEIGTLEAISSKRLEALTLGFREPPKAAADPLSGRVRSHCIFIEDLGSVIVKPYFRGGILRHLNRRTYLKAGKPRSVAEFEMLFLVRTFGVNAPEPFAYAFQKKYVVFYHAWLAMMEIPGTITLGELSRTDPSRGRWVLPELEKQINLLWDYGVLHVDLHPGNVLVDQMDRVYIIDFDKAKTGVTNRAGLAEYYVNRWRRAVSKHGLPEFLHNLKVG